MHRAIIIIDGYIQRDRYKVSYIARRHNLRGYIKNLEDGRVEIVVEGYKDRIESFIKDIDIKEYPIYVESIDVRYEDARNEFRSFKIITGSLEEEMVEGFGTGALYLDKILDTQREMLKKQDQTLDEISKVKEEVIGLRQDISNILDIRLRRLEEDMAKVKARLGID